MQQTTNYELNIIEPEIDNIDPTPINENMEAIDEALAPTYTESSTLTNLTSGEKISVAFGKIKKAIADFITHKNAASPHSGAYSADNPPYVTGVYTGDGAANKFVNLGFAPSAVYVGRSAYCGLPYKYDKDSSNDLLWGGLAITGHDAEISAMLPMIAITENGFTVYHRSNETTTNMSGQPYKYIAFR